MEFQELLTQYGAFSLHKQFLLSELLEEHDWVYSAETGKITFNEDDELSFSAQVLGTHSDMTRTFLYSWGNPNVDIPNELMQYAIRLKKIGIKKKIPQLTDVLFQTNEQINGFSIALIAMGLLDLNAVYVGYHEKGAIFLLIKDDKYPKQENLNPHFIENCFSAFYQTYTISNQRLAFTNYMKSLGLILLESKNKVVALHQNKKLICGNFDENNQLVLFDF